ncbi:MAG: toll/interleukin-1 receptor domain-containing protein [Bacteroidetes bacterium]|nr:MAG: toll/interleukin-1 receptor domain-containing protein [Bacteroidota bacterium]
MSVFISYSRADRDWLERLRPHLSLIRSKFDFEIWDDSQIQAGTNWREAISEAIRQAQVAVLIISPNFLSSKFIRNYLGGSILSENELLGQLSKQNFSRRSSAPQDKILPR